MTPRTPPLEQRPRREPRVMVEPLNYSPQVPVDRVIPGTPAPVDPGSAAAVPPAAEPPVSATAPPPATLPAAVPSATVPPSAVLRCDLVDSCGETSSDSSSEMEVEEMAQKKSPVRMAKKRKPDSPAMGDASPQQSPQRQQTLRYSALLQAEHGLIRKTITELAKTLNSANKSKNLRGTAYPNLKKCLDDLEAQIMTSFSCIAIETGRQLAQESQPSQNIDEEKLAAAIAAKIKMPEVDGAAIVRDVTRVVREESTRRPAPAPVTMPSGPPSYARMVKVSSGQPVTAAIPRKDHSVVVYPPLVREGETALSSEAVRTKIQEVLKPRDDGLQVTAFRNVGRSGVLIATRTAAEARKILDHAGLAAKGLRVEAGRRERPRLRIYDVPEVLDAGGVARCLHMQNLDHLSQEDFAAQVIVAKVSKSQLRPGTNVVLLEVSHAVRKALLEQERVFMDYSSCRVLDHLPVTRCFRCQAYGHPAKFCKLPQACSQCAGTHDVGVCPNKDITRCVNCFRQKKESGHTASSTQCPGYVQALEAAKRRTDYGSS